MKSDELERMPALVLSEIVAALQPKVTERIVKVVANLPLTYSPELSALVTKALVVVGLPVAKTKDGYYRSPFSMWCSRFSKALITLLREEAEAKDLAAHQTLEEELRTLRAERDEAVSALQRLTAGEPFDAVVVLDAIKRGTAVLKKQIEEQAEQLNRQGNTPGAHTVPFDPIEEQWNGLARDIMMWLDFDEPHTPRTLITHLNRLGRRIPPWFADENELKNADSPISKGTRVTLIYKAMLSDYKGNQ